MNLCVHSAHQHTHKEGNRVPCLDHICRSFCSLPFIDLESTFIFDKTKGGGGTKVVLNSMCSRRGPWKSHPPASTSGVLGLHTISTMPTVCGAVSSAQLSHSHIKGRTSHCRQGWPWAHGHLALPSEFWKGECPPKLSNWQRELIHRLIF